MEDEEFFDAGIWSVLLFLIPLVIVFIVHGNMEIEKCEMPVSVSKELKTDLLSCAHSFEYKQQIEYCKCEVLEIHGYDFKMEYE